MYVCDNCGQESPKWIGKCPACGQWNTFKEVKGVSPAPSKGKGGFAAGDISTRGRDAAKVLRLKDISAHDDPRIDMQDAELNRVLGGGLVPGSIVLLGGEPGIGKSTLSLQTMLNLTDKRVLYVSGEESAHQLKMRAERLAKATTGGSNSAVGGSPADKNDPTFLTYVARMHLRQQFAEAQAGMTGANFGIAATFARTLWKPFSTISRKYSRTLLSSTPSKPSLQRMLNRLQAP